MSFLLSLLLFSLTPQSPEEQDLQKFYSEIWSPYCKGNSLLECPSGQAENLRLRIRAERAEGKTFSMIRAGLENEYKSSLRMTPEMGARGRMAYLIPWVALLSILIVLFFYWRSRMRPATETLQSKASQLPDSVEAEIEERMR